MVLILIFGYGLSLDVTDAPIAVVLEDPSPIAAEVVSGLELFHIPLPCGRKLDAGWQGA